MLSFKHSLLAAVALSAGALCASPALAASATSSAFILSADLNVNPLGFPLASITVGPLVQASGTAPPDYSDSNTLASVDADFSLVNTRLLDIDANISTGLLESNASGSADGPVFANADATINDFAFSFVANPLVGPNILLGLIDATTIMSMANCSGSFGAVSCTGDTTIEDLGVDGLLGTVLLGLGLNLAASIDAAPNTVLLNALGVFIIANEQLLTGDGISTAGITVNALRFSFDAFSAGGLGVLDGEIILSQSMAAIVVDDDVVVPAPATLALFGLGLLAIGAARTRRT